MVSWFGSRIQPSKLPAAQARSLALTCRPWPHAPAPRRLVGEEDGGRSRGPIGITPSGD